MSNYQRYWDTPESVAEYSRAPFLLQGERLALSSGFAAGLKGKRVLDLACGGGRTTYFLHKMGAAVIGMDLAANLIEAARARYPDIEFRVGDMTELDFEDRSFDVVLISFNSLDCLYPKEMRLTALRQTWRVLRPDGTLILSHHNLAALFCGWYRFMRPAKLAYRLKHILDGSAWKSECYLPDFGIPELKLYYAYPRQVVADLHLCGFEVSPAIPNDPLLWGLQQALHTDFFTRLSDPWPYYVCRRTSDGALPSARAPAEPAH